MNDDRILEGRVASAYAEMAPAREPARLLDDVLLTTRRARQRPRWLALIKEPPMRISSRVAVGSPAARLASILLATLLLAVLATGAALAGAAFLAGPGVIVVAQDGSGDYTTITEAVAAAEDGDTILVKPGTYVGSVVIDEDLTLRGDGPRDQIVIQNAPDGPVADREVLSEFSNGPLPHFTLLVEDADATIGGLTVSGPRTGGITAIVIGGAPTLDDISIVLDGPPGTWEYWAALYILGDSRAHVLGSALNGYVHIGNGSSPTIEDTDIADRVYIDGSAEAQLLGDSFSSNPRSGYSGVHFVAGSIGSFEGNDLTAGAIEVSEGSDVEVRDNVVGGEGVRVSGEGTTATITGNTIAATFGISVGPGAEATIEGNTITGGMTGLALQSDSVRAESNTITGARIGIRVAGSATPTLTGNSLCDNETNLRVDDGNPTTLDGNEVCADLATAAPGG
jgi:parallel beta-helix repeat protein